MLLKFVPAYFCADVSSATFCCWQRSQKCQFNLTLYFQNHFTASVCEKRFSVGKLPGCSGVQDMGNFQCYNFQDAKEDKIGALCHCFLCGGSTHILTEVRLTVKSCCFSLLILLSLQTMSLSSSYLLLLTLRNS